MKKNNKPSNARIRQGVASPENEKKNKKPSKALAIINKLMPYILAVIFVVLLFTIIGELGFSRFLYGVFSKFASYFIIVFLLYHSLMWYYDTKRKICIRRVCCSVIIILSISMLQHIADLDQTGWVYKATEELSVNTPNIFELYRAGAAGNGGGVIGGGICYLALSSIGKGLTITILLIVLVFMFLQMFNITPVSIFKRIFRNRIEEKRARKEEARRRAMLSKKHKKFRVFDDDDNDMVAPKIDERILQAMNEESRFDEEDESDDDDALTVQRQPISTPQPQQSAPIQRSASPYRFSPEPASNYTERSYEKPLENNESENDFVLTQKTGYEDKPAVEYVDENSYEAENTSYEPYESFEPFSASGFEPIKDEPDEEPVQECVSEQEHDDEPPFEMPVKEQVQAPAKNPVREYADSEVSDAERRGLFANSIKKPAPTPAPVVEEKKEAPKPVKKKKKHIFPPIDIFELRADKEDQEAVNEELQEKARIIVETLKSFNLNTRIIDVSRGPTVTRYELMPEAGVKVRSIANLQDDIALYLAAEGIRMECPIPGKSAVGIEVPNSITSMVYLRSLLEDPKFKQAKSPVTCAVGKSISGENVYVDIAKLVHLLVAGATGQGKSVCINALLVSLLYKASPDELRLILIDPKRVEFAPYNGIPHLLVPVVTDVKKSVGTLQWSVSEMERRFELLEGAGVRDIGEFNERVDRGIIEDEKLPRIVIVIDELYDLKMQVPEIDDYIIRLTQKARAAGIHVIIGTQRPSVDVITGVIKANIPSRIAFRVPAQVDSRTILDEVGAEKLVARGDMLLKPVGALKPIRVQGAFITEDEREMVTNFLKENSSENYDESVISQIESNTAKLQKSEKKADFDSEDGEGGGSDLDEKFYAALELATDMGKISSSYLQRKLNLGFQRAARIIDQMEELGYIGEPNGSKPRDVLITKQDFQELMMRNEET